MSGEQKRVIHRLEPSKRPVVKNSTGDSEKLGSVSGVPQTINTQFFAGATDVHKDLETEWGKTEGGIKSRARQWLVLGVSAVAFFFLCCLVWGVFLASERAFQSDVNAIQSLNDTQKAPSRQQVIKKYLLATSVDEKLKYVREPERVKPLMEEFYSEHPLVGEKMLENASEVSFMGVNGVMWRVNVRKPTPSRSTYLIVDTNEAGVSRVDWEADVIYQPDNWDEFIAERGAEAQIFRVILQPAQLKGFYGYEFADYARYRCFKVMIPGNERYLWGYSERGSALDTELLNLVTVGGRRKVNTSRRIQAMVQLSFPENSQSATCVNIDALLQIGWYHSLGEK